MANPLACAVAGAALRLLKQKDWAVQVGAIETQLQQALLPLAALASVAEVRVLGAIGVMEMVEQVDVARAQALFIDRGVWLRPFGKLIYIMPAYVMTPADLQTVVDAMAAFARSLILTEPV